MRFTLLALALTTVVAASPYAAQPDPRAVTSTVPSSSANSATPTKTRTGHRNPHKEPTPTFKTGCVCDRPIIPAGVFSTKEMCQFKHYVEMACYEKSQGGCPSPPVMRC